MRAHTDFGLHDYNQGLAGVAEYAAELERIVQALRQSLGEPDRLQATFLAGLRCSQAHTDLC